jgi:hypothetical protein
VKTLALVIVGNSNFANNRQSTGSGFPQSLYEKTILDTVFFEVAGFVPVSAIGSIMYPIQKSHIYPKREWK